MIFRPALAELVASGHKTVTRRPANGPCRYRVGQDYAVQPGRTKRAICRILIVSIRRESLRLATSLVEAQREGFEYPSDFRETWVSIHGDYDPGAPVDRIEFEVMPDA